MKRNELRKEVRELKARIAACGMRHDNERHSLFARYCAAKQKLSRKSEVAK